MPEATPNNRRAADDEALALLKEIHATINDMKSAFVLNDLHKPDFDGHRKAHLAQIKAAEILEGYKQGVVKRILAWMVGGALTLMSAGFLAQLTGHLK